MSATTNSLKFDAAATLGIGTPSAAPIEGREGYITLRVPEGISLISLRDSDIGKKMLSRQDRYDAQLCLKATVLAGTYHIRLPISDSNNGTFEKQDMLLADGEEPIPITLAALTLLCLKESGLSDPLHNGWVRCQEKLAEGYHFWLTWNCGRLNFNHDRDDLSYPDVWFASARRIDPAA